ncbi:MAG: hypothetical protein ACLP36_02190 [Acidimicrobiales bacterium]|jgi:hypothetical protein
MDDPLIAFELHASTVDLIHSLLGALAIMSEGAAAALTTEQRSYLAQAMDIAADLDIVFAELAVAFERGPSIA